MAVPEEAVPRARIDACRKENPRDPRWAVGISLDNIRAIEPGQELQVAVVVGMTVIALARVSDAALETNNFVQRAANVKRECRRILVFADQVTAQPEEATVDGVRSIVDHDANRTVQRVPADRRGRPVDGRACLNQPAMDVEAIFKNPIFDEISAFVVTEGVLENRAPLPLAVPRANLVRLVEVRLYFAQR